MCLRINKRNTISAGAPNRPRLRLLGCRLASASYTAVTICSSASTSSACFIQPSRRSSTSSVINPSPKLSCARRISITLHPPALSRRRTQQLVIEFADRLDRLLQLVIIVEPTANLANPLAAHAELAGAPAGIADGENKDAVPFAARALRTSLGMADRPLQQRATHQLAGNRQSTEEFLPRPKG